LKELDELTEVRLEKCQCFLHEDHRWILPIIHYAQERGTLSKPCTLVGFDAHHDTRDPIPDSIERIRQIRASGVTFEALISLCKEYLNPNDDDWIKAGMELGLIRDVVVFGVQHLYDNSFPIRFNDHQGDEHRIEVLSLIYEELEYQGRLSDYCKSDSLSQLWAILDWEFIPKKGFSFSSRSRKILLDFDLDCFVISWRDYIFPWPDEVFQREFFTQSKYWSTDGWTGRMFLNELVNRAARLTFARESQFCGGSKKAEEVFSKVNRFLFDNKLSS
jgi:hypothetical protein